MQLLRWSGRSGRRSGTLVLIIAAGLAATTVVATPTAQRAAYRASVDLVTLNVTVTAPRVGYLADLTQEDFVVLEDNAPQQVSYFAKGLVPLALTLLIDTSASMEHALGTAQDAAVGFIRELGADDVASIIDFDSRVQVAQDFTDDAKALETAIRRTRAGGSTSLYNGLYIALKQLAKVPPEQRSETPRRRAIIVLSDGADTSSLVSFSDVLDVAARSDTVVYAIGLGPPEHSSIETERDGPFVLRRFAQQTGGRAYFPRQAHELAAIYGDIRQELASQYILAYTPMGPRDGRWRRIAVRVSRRNAAVRTRQGYYASRP